MLNEIIDSRSSYEETKEKELQTISIDLIIFKLLVWTNRFAHLVDRKMTKSILQSDAHYKSQSRSFEM